MKLNNRGIAISSVLYIILILAIILISSTLGILSSRKNILDKMKKLAREDIDQNISTYKQTLDNLKQYAEIYALGQPPQTEYINIVSVSDLISSANLTEQQKQEYSTQLISLSLNDKYIAYTVDLNGNKKYYLGKSKTYNSNIVSSKRPVLGVLNYSIYGNSSIIGDEIKSVGNKENDDYIIPILTTGKNLFNKENLILHKYVDSNGSFVNFTATENEDYAISEYIPVLPNETITISGKGGNSTTVGYAIYDINKNVISTKRYTELNKITLVTDKNTRYLVITCPMGGADSSEDTLQIEYGNKDTNYNQYSQSNTVNIRLNDSLKRVEETLDSINYSTNKLDKNINQIIFTGQETWTEEQIPDINKNAYSTTLSNLSKTNSDGICTYFDVSKDITYKAENKMYIGLSQGNTLKIIPSSYQTLANWNTYITGKYTSNKPFSCLYELNTSTKTDVQLEPIKLKYGVFNINVNSNVLPEKSIFEVVEFIKEL